MILSAIFPLSEVWTPHPRIWLNRDYFFISWGGWMRPRCRVSCVTGASNWYWLTVGQGLLFLHQVRVEGECFYFFCFFTFIPVSLSSLSQMTPPSISYGRWLTIRLCSGSSLSCLWFSCDLASDCHCALYFDSSQFFIYHNYIWVSLWSFKDGVLEPLRGRNTYL